MAFGTTRVLGTAPELAEATVGRVGPAAARALSLVTAAIPFSLAEALVAGYLLRRLWGLARGAADAARGRSPLRAVAGAGLRTMVRDAGFVVFFFYALWGCNYARPPLEARLALPEVPSGTAADSALVVRLSAELVDATNNAYRAIHGADDAGSPTGLAAAKDSLDGAIEGGWASVASSFALGSGEAALRGPYKEIFASSLLARIGISGFYFPFTGEANVNRDVPAVMLPQVVAHEKAHQRGIAPEDEANFFGCLVALASPDPVARYAGLVFAQRQLLRAHFVIDAARARELVASRVPGVQRDIDDLIAYWRRYEGPASEVSHKLNDAYLKSNRVEGGIESYGKSVELLLRYAASRGGTLADESR
jgi:hypothetical protein